MKKFSPIGLAGIGRVIPLVRSPSTKRQSVKNTYRYEHILSCKTANNSQSRSRVSAPNIEHSVTYWGKNPHIGVPCSTRCHRHGNIISYDK